MRASETVSEASPGSTASQTGVPTQVVQQVQGTQQVGHAPPPGWTESTPRGQRGYGYSDLASPTPSPAAGTICSPVLIKMLTAKKKIPTPPPRLSPTPARPPWGNQPGSGPSSFPHSGYWSRQVCRPSRATCHPSSSPTSRCPSR